MDTWKRRDVHVRARVHGFQAEKPRYARAGRVAERYFHWFLARLFFFSPRALSFRSQLTLSSVRQNLILIDVSTKTLAVRHPVQSTGKKKKKEKSWETPSFNGIIYTPSKHRWIMILKLSRSERIYRTNFGFRSVGRVLISITSALCGVRAITVHGSAGHRPFTAFISTFRSI